MHRSVVAGSFDRLLLILYLPWTGVSFQAKASRWVTDRSLLATKTRRMFAIYLLHDSFWRDSDRGRPQIVRHGECTSANANMNCISRGPRAYRAIVRVLYAHPCTVSRHCLTRKKCRSHTSKLRTHYLWICFGNARLVLKGSAICVASRFEATAPRKSFTGGELDGVVCRRGLHRIMQPRRVAFGRGCRVFAANRQADEAVLQLQGAQDAIRALRAAWRAG